MLQKDFIPFMECLQVEVHSSINMDEMQTPFKVIIRTFFSSTPNALSTLSPSVPSVAMLPDTKFYRIKNHYFYGLHFSSLITKRSCLRG